VPFCSDPHDNLNVLCGYLKRISPVQREITLQATEGLRYEVDSLFKNPKYQKHLQPLPRYEDNFGELTMQWILSNPNYNEARKKQLLIEAQRLNYSGLRLTPRHYNCKSFIKREFYEEDKYPRLINSRSDIFKILVGPYISLIEKQMYQMPFFVKHNTPKQLANKLQHFHKYRYLLQTDYSSFESCFQLPYTEIVEIEMFKRLLINNPLVLKVILNCYYHGPKPRVVKLKNKEYEAYTTGSRLSGEMWTSLGNGFSNLINIKTLCRKYNIKMKGFVEGDDGLFSLSKNLIKQRDFEELGFNIKMKYETNIQNTSFCSLTYDKESNELLANPEQISRLGWTCRSTYLNARITKVLGLLKAKAMSSYSQNPCTPILGPLCYRIIHDLPHIRENKIDIYEKFVNENTEFSYKPIPISARLIYAEIFHVSLEQQEICERIIRDSKDIFHLNLPFTFLSEKNEGDLI